MLITSGVRARRACAKMAERRAVQRFFPSNPDARCQVAAVVGGDFWLAVIRDLSVTGVSLEFEQPIAIECLLTVELLNRGGDFTYTVLVWVVHVTESAGGHTAGCRFTQELGEAELQKLVT